MSRITPEKGADVAARVCREQDLDLRIAGPVAGQPSRAALDERPRAPDAPLRAGRDVRHYLEAVLPHENGKVRWLGNLGRRAKTGLIARARALLMPIRWEEPDATVASEAPACGTPMVGMRRGALIDIVEHGVTGFLADDESQLAGFLRRCGELDTTACRHAAEQRYSAATMAERYVDLYEQVLRRGTAAP